jgi:hypothetical protein
MVLRLQHKPSLRRIRRNQLGKHSMSTTRLLQLCDSPTS